MFNSILKLFVSSTLDTNWWSNKWEYNHQMEDKYTGDRSKDKLCRGLPSMSIMSFIISVSNSEDI